MPKIIINGNEYSGVPIEVVTAWAPTADPVQVKEPLMGNTDISDIGDGTVTGAIDTVNDGLIALADKLDSVSKIRLVSTTESLVVRFYINNTSFYYIVIPNSGGAVNCGYYAG